MLCKNQLTHIERTNLLTKIHILDTAAFLHRYYDALYPFKGIHSLDFASAILALRALPTVVTQARTVQANTVAALDVLTHVQRTVADGRQNGHEHQQQQKSHRPFPPVLGLEQEQKLVDQSFHDDTNNVSFRRRRRRTEGTGDGPEPVFNFG